MRRRPTDTTAPTVPEGLRTFDPHMWAGGPWEAFSAWRRARWAYWKANPDAWPHALAVIAGGADVRAKLDGRQPPYREHDEGY